MRVCTVCVHPDITDIDAQLAGSLPVAVIAREHGLGPEALRRHLKNHLTPSLARAAIGKRLEGSAESYLDRMEALAVQIQRMLDLAENKQALVGGSQLARELRMLFETAAKITGELDERPQNVNVSVTNSPDWWKLRSVLMETLAAFPDAEEAVLAALSTAQEGSPPAIEAPAA